MSDGECSCLVINIGEHWCLINLVNKCWCLMVNNDGLCLIDVGECSVS